MTHRINWNSTRSIKNWVTSFDLECASKTEIGMQGVYAALGMGIGFAILPRLSDYFGRKPIFVISGLISIIFMCLILTFTYKFVFIAALWFGAFSTAGRLVIGFVWVQDFMGPKGIDVATSVLFFFDGLVSLIASVYFRYINKDWRYFIAAGIVPMTISLLSVLCSPESPKYYHDKFKFDEAREVLTIVGHMNGTIPRDQRFLKKFDLEMKIEEMKK